MRFSNLDLAISAVIALLTIGQATSYPSYLLHQQRKADPFVALANTLRQEQEQEALQQQQQQPQQQQPLDNGYYYDYGPSDDDLYQMAQFQRQLSRAAVVPFFGRTQRNSWGNLVLDDSEYGYPVEAELTGSDQQEAPLSEWYDAAVDEEEMGREQKQQEGQLLLDMLTEYMLMYGGAGQPDVAEENKRAAVDSHGNATEEAVKPAEANGQPEVAMTTTTTTPKTTVDVQQQPLRKEKQPPVRKGQDGTPLGQQEFPMMRPAAPQRNQWLASTQMFQNKNNNNGKNNHFQSMELETTNKKRHYKGKNMAKKSSIVTSEDELIEELDNLKMKKN